MIVQLIRCQTCSFIGLMKALRFTRLVLAFDLSNSLTVAKADLRRLRWPVFVYSFLGLIKEYYVGDAPRFFEAYAGDFEVEHPDDLREMKPISLPEHLGENWVSQIYLTNKYRLTLSNTAFFNLVQFLEINEKQGGSVVMRILNEHLKIVTVDRIAPDQNAFTKLTQRADEVEDFPAEDEGIPGHNPGSANVDNIARPSVLTKLKLGAMPMEAELLEDVRGDLADEDAKEPSRFGKPSFLEHFETMIKREEGEDYPTTADITYPPSRARDVALEVQKVKENRDRFKIDGRTGGAGAGVSIAAFTIHNGSEM